MNAIEQALRKYERNRVNQGRNLPKGAPPVEELPLKEYADTISAEVKPEVVEHEIKPVVVEPVVVPRETKPTTAATFDVKVTLPNGEYEIRFVRRNIYGNVTPSKMTRQEVAKMIAEGLEKYIGRVETK